MRIYKYLLEFQLRQAVELPIGAEILTVQLQDGKPHLWAMVDEHEKTTEHRSIRMFHTGEPAERCSRYIATLQVRDGDDPWVAHVFEE